MQNILKNLTGLALIVVAVIGQPCRSKARQCVETAPSGARNFISWFAPQDDTGEAKHHEPPYQKARLMSGMGDVEFRVTTTDPLCQKFINQGLAQLHGFWHLEAERSFRQAALHDKDCAAAWWGAALAAEKSPKRARRYIDVARELRDTATEREQMYINAFSRFTNESAEPDAKTRSRNYVAALESIATQYPEDIEAKALLAHRLWVNTRLGIPIQSRLAVAALLDEVFAVAPNHPAHHYAIHLWDHHQPEKARRSAELCGHAASGIPHMWHMPGHTWSEMKLFQQAACYQEAAARVAHSYMHRDHVFPGEVHDYAHNAEWLVRSLIQNGDSDKALQVAVDMVRQPRHPKYNNPEESGSVASLGVKRLVQTLKEFELHETARNVLPEIIEDLPECEARAAAREQLTSLESNDGQNRDGESSNNQALSGDASKNKTTEMDRCPFSKPALTKNRNSSAQQGIPGIDQLESMGPLLWSPPLAPDWQLPTDNGLVGQAVYEGRSVLLIFYLGHGCLHCAEQLQAFGPQVKNFREAGIDVMAISTDDLKGLNLSVKNYGGDVPMELFADPDGIVFRKFRAWDDFQKEALHGTFLIDPSGRIVWQDISEAPFMDARFLLAEAVRLLRQQ